MAETISRVDEVAASSPENKKPNFYDSKYWEHGQGQLLWNLRKLQAFIMEVSSEDTPCPFLSVLHKSDYDDTWMGWYASWNESGDSSLTLEYEGTEFSIHVMDVEKDENGKYGKVETRFWYNFGGDTSEDENNEWSDMGNAIRDTRAWLVEHREVLKLPERMQIDREFNIY